MPKRKKMLHIQKTPPEGLQQLLMRILSLGYDSLQFPLFEGDGGEVDYEELIDLIFECDEVVTWW